MNCRKSGRCGWRILGNLPENGVLVADVDRGSGLGLEAGDVVIRIGDRSVDSPERFRRIVGSYAEEEDITFHILRNGAETAVTGRLRY